LKFVLDESVDAPIAERLKNDGHNVSCVWDLALGISDEEVLKLANETNALLITADRDFGELVFRMKKLTCGIILVRLSGLSVAKKPEIVSEVISKYGKELSDSFTVITPGLIRIRNKI